MKCVNLTTAVTWHHDAGGVHAGAKSSSGALRWCASPSAPFGWLGKVYSVVQHRHLICSDWLIVGVKCAVNVRRRVYHS
jgi:hypothetical protein